MQDDCLPQLWQGMVAVVQKHLGQTGHDVEWLADRLISHGLLNGAAYEVFDRPRDVAALRRVDRALLEIERAISDASLTSAAARVLHAKLLFGPLSYMPSPQDEKPAYSVEQGTADFEAFHRISSGASVFRNAVKATISDIERNPFAKRSRSQLNTEAIGLVAGCRWVWLQATGREAPLRDLNPATKFAAFLADVMKTCHVEGDPRSAFKAWVKLNGDP